MSQQFTITKDNLVGVNGIAPSVGNGVSGTGVLRVTLASDGTGQVTLAAGSNTIGALTANQSVNLNQLLGNALAAGTGISGTGTLRVTLATDIALPTGSNTIGALTANQSVNVAQINGVTTLMGNGITGTGSQRVTIASDNTAFTVNAAQSGTWNITNVSGTVSLPTGASTSANQTTEITSLQLIDDIVHSGDAVLSKYAVIGAVLDDVGTVAVTENQAQSLRMSSRRALLVEGVASGTAVTVSGSGTFTTSDTATQVDDAAFTPATGRVMMVGAEFDDVSPDSVNEGDGGAVRMSANRNLYVTLRDAAGNERGLNIDSAGALAVTNSAATTGAPGGVTVSTSAVILKASNSSRKSVLVSNNGTGNLFVGNANTVTASGANMGILVKPGGVYTDGPFGLYTGDIYGIYDTTSASQNVSVWERT